MMDADVLRLIQLAVAPVFLLSAVATTLAVLTARLGRVVDRGRFLEGKGAAASAAERAELAAVEKRARFIYIALTLGVLSAICVSLLMGTAFFGALIGRNVGWTVAVLFIVSMFAYTAALVFLLREVFVAVLQFRLGIHDAPRGTVSSRE